MPPERLTSSRNIPVKFAGEPPAKSIGSTTRKRISSDVPVNHRPKRACVQGNRKKARSARAAQTNSSADHSQVGLVADDNAGALTTTTTTLTEGETCPICLCEVDKPKRLDKCGHEFCVDCIDQCFAKVNPICPICGEVYGVITGNMPYGIMNVNYSHQMELPGYHGCGTVIIEYIFPNGTQTQEHPHPGRPYRGTRRVAFLPDNEEGRKVCGLLRRAFDSRLTFTVGRSATTGIDDCVIWNDIHHKTSPSGGPTEFGYPDPTYLSRVQQELASKGIK